MFIAHKTKDISYGTGFYSIWLYCVCVTVICSAAKVVCNSVNWMAVIYIVATISHLSSPIVNPISACCCTYSCSVIITLAGVQEHIYSFPSQLITKKSYTICR